MNSFIVLKSFKTPKEIKPFLKCNIAGTIKNLSFFKGQKLSDFLSSHSKINCKVSVKFEEEFLPKDYILTKEIEIEIIGKTLSDGFHKDEDILYFIEGEKTLVVIQELFKFPEFYYKEIGKKFNFVKLCETLESKKGVWSYVAIYDYLIFYCQENTIIMEYNHKHFLINFEILRKISDFSEFIEKIDISKLEF